MNKPTNLTAFPVAVPAQYDSVNAGMTLLDYFAARAMQALVVDSTNIHKYSISAMAYSIAQDMLIEREKNI